MGDTWQALCHNAWKRPMHVGHMACHVSTCMALLKAIYMGVPIQFVEGSKNKRKEGERENKEGKREKGGK